MATLTPVDHDPFANTEIPDMLAATAGVSPAGTPRVDQIDWGGPSWLQKATEQSQRDEAAYARGGIGEMLRDTEGTQDLAGGFSDAGIMGKIKAFHASPHDFEKFDISKIGTGEGAQAYGHGLYFAEAPATMEEYYKNFEGRMIPGASTGKSKYLVNGQEMPSGIAGHAALDTGGEMDMLLGIMHANPTSDMIPFLKQKIEARIANHYSMQTGGIAGDDMRAMAEFYNQHVKNAEPKDVQPRPTPTRYEVDINADPEHFLDWDKPLSEQHPKVQEAVGKLYYPDGPIETPMRVNREDVPGRDLYEAASKYGEGKDAAATRLREAGIPGIKYLDQGSRGNQYFARPSGGGKYGVSDYDNVGYGEFATLEEAQKAADAKNAEVPKTSNYVVFDDKLIDIVKKYGIVGMLAAGAGYELTPVDHDPFKASQ